MILESSSTVSLQGFVFVQNNNIDQVHVLLPTGAKKDHSTASHCAYFSLTSGYTFKGDSLVVRVCYYGKIANLTMYQPSWSNVAVVATTCSSGNLRVWGLTT